MPYVFNPFSGNFDLVNEDVGGGGITQVETFADLPTASSVSGQTFEVRSNTGIWPYSLGLGTQKGFYRSNGTTYDKVEISAETIQQKIDEHANDTNNPHNTTITQVVAADSQTDITTTELEELTSGSVTTLHKHKRFIHISGRFNLSSNADWASWSDPASGPSFYLWDTFLGNGATPNEDWDAIGVAFPAGSVLKSISMKFRSNNAQAETLEVFARVHDVDLSLGNPIDSDVEVASITVVPPTTFDLTTGGTKQSSGLGQIDIPLGDYQFNNLGDLHLMARGVAEELSANRQLRCTLVIEYELA